jgi:hypothetical protein
MEEFEAFVSFSNLVENPFFKVYSQMQISDLQATFSKFDSLFALNLPPLHRTFKKSGLIPDCYVLEWFMTLFSQNLSLECGCLVWDGFFIEGELYAHKAAIAILMHLEKELLTLNCSKSIQRLRGAVDMGPGELLRHIKRIRIPTP